MKRVTELAMPSRRVRLISAKFGSGTSKRQNGNGPPTAIGVEIRNGVLASGEL
jgi:hypothetical protein